MSRWKWVAVAALAFLAGHAHADFTGKARVVIDGRTGTVVITENVRIGTVAIAHGKFAILITNAQQVSPPGPFAQSGETFPVPRTRIRVDEGKGREGKGREGKGREGKGRRLVVLPGNVTLRELVNRLNELGVSPRDLIGVLQGI